MMAIVQTYRDLEVWKLAMDLTQEAYQLTKAFPKAETYGLSSQLQRAAVSVPANIAEGHGRRSRKEYCHHLSIARGSLAELETHVQLAQRFGYVSEKEADTLWCQAQRVGRLLNGLLRALTERNDA